MKSVFDKSVREELIQRISSLNENSTAQWGKMNVWQMTKHCTLWDDWILGKNEWVYRQEWLGKIFGKMALKSSVKDERPIGKNMPAGKRWIVKEKNGDLEMQKKNWIGLINGYGQYYNPDFIHDFFGKMTLEQIGIFAYKHSDHHLNQFGV